MNSKLIRLTESDLHRIVKESVNRILNEDYFDDNNFGRFHAIDDKGKSAMEVLDAIHNNKGMGAIGRQTPQQHWDMQRDAISAEKQRESDKRNRMKTKASDRRWMKAADSRPLHRKGSLNRIGVTEASSYDMLKYDTIQKYGNDDPMNLSDSELRSRIEYMLAYRWALEGQEYILDEYMEEARSRGI